MGHDMGHEMNSSHPLINGDRLWQRIMAMAEIGGLENGGCNRQALTDEDKQGRDLFCAWAKDAGCDTRIDEMGNIFARLPGTDADALPIIAGSHLDTQPTGGKFDGVYGVLAALEVCQTIHESNLQITSPIDVVVWTNEEGSRFSPAMIGSGVFGGEFSLDYAYQQQDKNGVTFGQALKEIGYAGAQSCAPFPIKAAFEVHIEQGPILESRELPIGVVHGVQGMRWFDLILTGDPVHAGPTPMEARTDPAKALSLILPEIYRIAEQNAPDSRATIGDISAHPGSRNTVPRQIKMAVDLRHPDEATLDDMEQNLRRVMADISAETGVNAELDEIWKSPAVEFDAACIAAIQKGAEKLNLNYLDMVSGAGHDSVYVSRVAPTAMIFIPCKDGISHNEREDAQKNHIEMGANILLHTILEI